MKSNLRQHPFNLIKVIKASVKRKGKMTKRPLYLN